MPLKKIFGESIDPGSVGEYQVPSNPIPKATPSPIQYDRFARNGRHPSAHFMNQLMEHANCAAVYRGKIVYSSLGPTFSALNSTASSRVRVRAAWHSGPYTHALQVAVVMMTPSAGAGTDADSYAKVSVFDDVAESSLVVSGEFHYGAAPFGTAATEGLPSVKMIMKTLDGISPDTDYYLKVSDENYGRIISVLAFELNSLTENALGYLPTNITPLTPLVDSFREKLATLTRDMWSKGAGSLFCWNADDHASPRTISSGTFRNLFDGSSTSVSVSTPGVTLDLTNRDRVSQTSGVPCVLVAFAKMSGASDTGEVALIDSTGTQVGTSIHVTGSTAQWYSQAVTVPASGKFDVHYANPDFGSGGETMSVYACGLYQLD